MMPHLCRIPRGAAGLLVGMKCLSGFAHAGITQFQSVPTPLPSVDRYWGHWAACLAPLIGAEADKCAVVKPRWSRDALPMIFRQPSM